MELQQRLQAKEEDFRSLQAKCQSHRQLVDAVEGASPCRHLAMCACIGAFVRHCRGIQAI